MRKWLAGKFFNLAVWLDWDVALLNSLAVLFVEAGKRRLTEPKKKRGRPLGSKNKPKV